MSIVVPILLFILLLAGGIVLDVFGWKQYRHLFFAGGTFLGFVGNITFFIMMGYYNSLAVSQRESLQVAADFVPYSKYAIVCAMFAIALLGLMLFSILFWVGKYFLNKQEGTYFRG